MTPEAAHCLVSCLVTQSLTLPESELSHAHDVDRPQLSNFASTFALHSLHAHSRLPNTLLYFASIRPSDLPSIRLLARPRIDQTASVRQAGMSCNTPAMEKQTRDMTRGWLLLMGVEYMHTVYQPAVHQAKDSPSTAISAQTIYARRIKTSHVPHAQSAGTEHCSHNAGTWHIMHPILWIEEQYFI